MKILEKEAKCNIKNPLHTKDLLKFKIVGRDGSQWFLIRIRSNPIYYSGVRLVDDYLVRIPYAVV